MKKKKPARFPDRLLVSVASKTHYLSQYLIVFFSMFLVSIIEENTTPKTIIDRKILTIKLLSPSSSQLIKKSIPCNIKLAIAAINNKFKTV